MEVLPYFGNRYTTFVGPSYESTKVFILSKVPSYFRTKYESTKVLSYFRKYESTKVLSYEVRYYIIVRVHVQQTYFHLGRYNALAGWVA